MTRFKTRIDLDKTTRGKLVDRLNLALCTTLDLSSQVKQAHWNIKGPTFLSRHALFDDLSDHLRGWSDNIAERATALGGYADGTVRDSAKNSALPAYDKDAIQGRAHVHTLAERYGKYTGMLREMVIDAENMKDVVTEDLLTEVLRGAEMDLWFLEAQLEE